jgi:hypothetical protein
VTPKNPLRRHPIRTRPVEVRNGVETRTIIPDAPSTFDPTRGERRAQILTGEGHELQDPADVHRDHACEQADEQAPRLTGPTRHRTRDECSRRRCEQVATRRAEEPTQPTAAVREDRGTERADRHIRGEGHRSEAWAENGTRQDHHQWLQRDRHRRPRKRNRDLSRERGGNRKCDHA